MGGGCRHRVGNKRVLRTAAKVAIVPFGSSGHRFVFGDAQVPGKLPPFEGAFDDVSVATMSVALDTISDDLVQFVVIKTASHTCAKARHKLRIYSKFAKRGSCSRISRSKAMSER